MDEVELNEKLMLERDLQEFQRARRKLLEDAKLITSKSNYNLKSASTTSSCVLRILCPKCGSVNNDDDEDSDDISLTKPYKYRHLKASCPLEMRAGSSRRKEKLVVQACSSKERTEVDKDVFPCCKKV